MCPPSEHDVSSDALEAGIRERLAVLLAKHRKSELARRAGVPRHYLSRYLSNTRIPASFCSKLVLEVGVNPSWLLTGEGAPYLSDVTANVKQTAGDLLELVRAMSSVERMRLGSLVGTEHGLMLKELNGALSEYETLRGRIEARVRPALEALLDDFGKAISRQELDRAQDLVAAIEQLMRLNSDEELRIFFQEGHATLMHLTGADSGEVLRLQLEPLWYVMIHSRRWDRDFYRRAYNYVVTLLAVFRRAEARAFCRAVQELAAPQHPLPEHMYALELAQALCDTEAGNLRAALPVLANYRRFTGLKFSNVASHFQFAAFCAGGIGFGDFVKMAGDMARAANLVLRAALWTEDAEHLRLVFDGLAADPRAAEKNRLAGCARLLQDALEGNVLDALQRFDSETGGVEHASNSAPGTQILLRTLKTRLLWRARMGSEAAGEVHATQTFLDAMPSELDLPFLYMAMHWRNVLDVLPATEEALHRKARAFFDRMTAQGCGLFATLTGDAASVGRDIS